MSLNCPACGNVIESAPGLVSIVCKYCKTISLIDRGVLVSTGDKSIILPFPTIFEVGFYYYAIIDNFSNDKIKEKKVLYLSQEEFNNTNKKDFLVKIYVYGHIRYVSDGGFFDDFFVRIIEDNLGFDKNKEYILGENEGLISLYIIKKIYTNVDENVFNSKVGTSWNNYFVQEVGVTQIEGFEGSFPFFISINDKNKYVNLIKDLKQTQLKCIGNDILEFNQV